MSRLAALGAVISLFLAGCASTHTRPFDSVKLGMDKAQVLEIIGNPARSDHVNGADRWAYDDYKTGDREVVSVYFNNGKVSFVGSDNAYESKVNAERKTSAPSGDYKEL